MCRRERTYSICPVCGRMLEAARVHQKDGVYMEKECPEHGHFSTVLWRGKENWDTWKGNIPPVEEEEAGRCAGCRGLCPSHRRSTCCTLLEVTGRCNLACTFCFAGSQNREDPPLEQVKEWIRDLTEPGKTFLQLSGGEPTVREDLPEIIAWAKECGCRYIQLNTNGIRLAEEESYGRKLAEAGLSFVFLQFDGVTEEPFEKLRKRPLLACKKRAIENCGRAGLGVTLVPVIVPGLNDRQIGDIIRFGIRHSPVVRGVHFQPVSYFGRVPRRPGNEDRFTLDQLVEAVAEQSGGLVRKEDLAPSCCDHPMCGFHGDFVVMPGDKLMPLTVRKKNTCCCGPENPAERKKKNTCCGPEDPAERNREFIGRRWLRRGAAPAVPWKDEKPEIIPGAGLTLKTEPMGEPDMYDLDVFLERVKTFGFTLTSMHFQDACNLDLERLRQCSLHVWRDGRLIPFCAAYMSVFG